MNILDVYRNQLSERHFVFMILKRIRIPNMLIKTDSEHWLLHYSSSKTIADTVSNFYAET